MDLSSITMTDDNDLDDFGDLDETLMKAAMNFVSALASKCDDGNSMVPNDDDDLSMDTSYYDPPQKFNAEETYILQINSPPVAVPSFDEKHCSPNFQNKQTVTVPNLSGDKPLPSDLCMKHTPGVQRRQSLDERRVPINDLTPVLDKIDVPRAPKRKIFELYRNSSDFFQDKKSEADMPRIVMKFRLSALPNPVSKEVREIVRTGKLTDARSSIRADLLYNVGCYPAVAGRRDGLGEYQAVSRSLYMNQETLRSEINAVNELLRKIPKSKNRINLDEEYDKLLQNQIPHLTRDELGKEKTVTKNVDEIFELDGTIYMKLTDREFIVPPVSIVLERLNDTVIEAVLAPPNTPPSVEDDMIDSFDLDLFN